MFNHYIAIEIEAYAQWYTAIEVAVYHVGKGLSNVPLAQLQEVVVTIRGNWMEIDKVDYILGPVQNANNLLRGKISLL